MSDPNRKVTIVDVAREAGTSYSTVSRALSNTGKVKDSTRKHILKVAERLGYVPNQQARSLVGGQTKVIGVLIPRFDDGYVSMIVNGIDDEVSAAGYDLLLHTTRRTHRKEQEFVQRIVGGMAEGLIVVLPRHAEEYLQALTDRNFPYVFIDHIGTSQQFTSVSATNWRGAYDATQYLIQLGHTRIGFITGLLDVRSGLDRLHGYQAALRDHQLPIDNELIVRGNFMMDSGYDAATTLLQLPQRPTAIFASNDLSAFGAINAVVDQGLRVPQDMSIIGFDNIPAAETFQTKVNNNSTTT